ncbi:hypothetical protein F383_10802 [Gossypium arboreum]|uniref:Uncharacterized protein n=1 Tax=Gossypium arboreum TaxID=29729 RepID=A0A0B0MBJ7_GOSAR|nr:hypothetical protein F383_10802 [Gossypium arboreum]
MNAEAPMVAQSKARTATGAMISAAKMSLEQSRLGLDSGVGRSALMALIWGVGQMLPEASRRCYGAAVFRKP